MAMPPAIVDKAEQLEAAGVAEVAAFLQSRAPDKLCHCVTSIAS